MDSTGWHRDPPWNDEIARRIAELDLGKAKTIPWGEVRQRISAKLRNDRKPVRLHEDVDAEYEDAFDWYLARNPHAAAGLARGERGHSRCPKHGWASMGRASRLA